MLFLGDVVTVVVTDEMYVEEQALQAQEHLDYGQAEDELFLVNGA